MNDTNRPPSAPDSAATLTDTKLWCETCEGTGKVYQEHQKGCWVGGEHQCPDCDGNGYWMRHAATATAPSAPTDPVRVACVTLDGTTLTVPVDQIGDVLHGEDDQHTYTLTLKTMTRAEFDALGEFDGF